jgi:hypothetical protein
MLESRGIKRGVEVYVKDMLDPYGSERKAHVINTYPSPSSVLVVQYDDDGSLAEVDEGQVTTMFEKNRDVLF